MAVLEGEKARREAEVTKPEAENAPETHAAELMAKPAAFEAAGCDLEANRRAEGGRGATEESSLVVVRQPSGRK